MPAITIHSVPTSGATIVGDLTPAPAIRSEIDALWEAAIRQSPDLFDGPVLSAISLTAERLELVRASYRHVVAARRSPRLNEFLRLRPLAVSGILTCPQGVVLGRRGGVVSQNAGLWELAPSGGVEYDAADVEPDFAAQILKELREEIGLAPDHVRIGSSIGMIEVAESACIDMVIPLATDLSAEEIVAVHRALEGAEYSELRIAAPYELRGWPELVPESKAIIEKWICAPAVSP